MLNLMIQKRLRKDPSHKTKTPSYPEGVHFNFRFSDLALVTVGCAL